jgi:hypothetical protein
MFVPRALLELKALVHLPPALERFLARRPQGRRFPGLHCYPRARVLGRYAELSEAGLQHLLPIARSDEGREISVNLQTGAVYWDHPTELLAGTFEAFLEKMKAAAADAARRPLVVAARKGDLHRIDKLLARGHDINEQDIDGNTPLMAALLAWQYDAAARLLDNGPDLERRDRAGHTALMWACYRNQPGLVARLLAAGADPDARTRLGERVLLFALTGPYAHGGPAGYGSAEVLRLLREHGVDLTAPVDRSGRTARAIAEAEGTDDLRAFFAAH